MKHKNSRKMDIAKNKITLSDLIKGATMLVMLVGLYWKMHSDMEILTMKVEQNTKEISKNESENKDEFKLIHNEIKAVRKAQTENTFTILDKIEGKHSK